MSDPSKTQVKLRVGYFVKMFPRLSETFVLNEILELERQGVEVVIFSIKKSNEGCFHPQLSELKARVFYLDDLDPKKWSSWLRSKWDILDDKKDNIWKLLDEELSRTDKSRADYIWWSAWAAAEALRLNLSHLHAHFATMPSTVAYFTSRISGIPFSFTAHAKDIFVYEPSETLLLEKCARSSFVITVTHFNKNYFHRIAPEISQDKIRVLHNGVNLENFSYNDQSERKDNLILAIGRLVPKKGFHTLLEACSELRQRGRDFECIIVGDGSERESLQTQLDELNLNSSVKLVGSKTSEEVRYLMERATVVCLPCCVGPDNNQDALPTVLLEALACGVPSVSTNVSGIPEIIESGKEGYLVDPEAPQETADRLEQILADKKLRERFGKEGRAKAESLFSLQKNVGVLHRFFRSSLDCEAPHVQSGNPSANIPARKESDVRS